ALAGGNRSAPAFRAVRNPGRSGAGRGVPAGRQSAHPPGEPGRAPFFRPDPGPGGARLLRATARAASPGVCARSRANLSPYARHRRVVPGHRAAPRPERTARERVLRLAGRPDTTARGWVRCGLLFPRSLGGDAGARGTPGVARSPRVARARAHRGTGEGLSEPACAVDAHDADAG